LSVSVLALAACEKKVAKAPESEVPDTIQSAGDAATKVIDDSANKVKKSAEEIKVKATNVVDSAAQAAAKEVDKTGEAAESALKKISDKAHNAVDAVKENVPAADEAGKDMQ